MVVTIAAESDEAKRAFAAADTHGGEFVVVPRTEHGFATVGTVARVEQLGDLPNGTAAAVVRGTRRVRVGQGSIGESGALEVRVEEIPRVEPDDEARSLAAEYRDVAKRLLDAIGGREARALVADDASPDVLADTIAWWPALTFEQRVELLETINLHERLRLALGWARDALTEVEVTRDIEGEVSGHFEKMQRDAVLRRRLQAIQEELGEESGGNTYREKLAALADSIPEATHAAIEKEIDHLDRVGEQSMESSWIRTWLDTVFEIPFASRTDDNLDLTNARAVLDADHSGLDEVKERIVEFLAVRKLRAERNVDTSQHRRAGTILVLAGPPGVGKTSLGESVARALGRKFVRTALGGIHDEAEIRGHRRTYVGARPGRIVRALIDSGTMNPVLLLDEIDKLGSDYRGDPTSALLEVLDPAQNHTFRDHYLELELDLSAVVFIATANTLERVPAPLLDRMEVITISGYSEHEKLAIARDHLLSKVFDRNGVNPDEVVVSDEVVRAIIGDYTREAGVRRLEQRLDRVVRKAATKLAMGEATPPVEVKVDDLKDALGRAVIDEKPKERVLSPGIATGLAVTGAGGDVLYVEAVTTEGEGLTLTGQLGDVMRESGEIALSYLRAHADELGIDPSKLNRRFHIHFPAGAIPKDGPSAGVTMTTAIASLLRDTKVRNDVAMTGEVTLQGRVLPIGGVKEKVLAAHRAGVRHVILPEANRLDADDVPEDVREQIELHYASTVNDVLAVALEA
jgi:ATP-dependent Lon protease